MQGLYFTLGTDNVFDHLNLYFKCEPKVNYCTIISYNAATATPPPPYGTSSKKKTRVTGVVLDIIGFL